MNYRAAYLLDAALYVVLAFGLGSVVTAQPYLVENGEPRAEIVISPEPPRMAKLAAEELQTYIEKISGATLPIVTEPGDAPVQVYVGQSSHTDSLGVTDEGLNFGAYRMVSGARWADRPRGKRQCRGEHSR